MFVVELRQQIEGLFLRECDNPQLGSDQFGGWGGRLFGV